MRSFSSVLATPLCKSQWIGSHLLFYLSESNQICSVCYFVDAWCPSNRFFSHVVLMGCLFVLRLSESTADHVKTVSTPDNTFHGQAWLASTTRAHTSALLESVYFFFAWLINRYESMEPDRDRTTVATPWSAVGLAINCETGPVGPEQTADKVTRCLELTTFRFPVLSVWMGDNGLFKKWIVNNKPENNESWIMSEKKKNNE